MDYLSREQIINELQKPLPAYMNQYGIDDIGIFEEEGEDDLYFMGYTINKEGKTYHIHSPYRKGDDGGLTPAKAEWTVESDEPDKKDLQGYQDIESALREI
ncbi:DUF5634 family protein [Bacillus dakarensis]|uniref:DUF5634 family protein n=1 Tax=Robertmurraya dakarensis TaxID=1926278 RepID=UPI0009817E03|nr:DUF5634 family protein [Bacillus dakarensis]